MSSMRRNAHVNFTEKNNSVYIHEMHEKRYGDSPSLKPERSAVHVGDFFAFGIILGVCASLMDVIAVAIPWWTYYTRVTFGTVVQTNAGLWSVCREYTEFDGEFSSSCTKLFDPEDFIRDTRIGNMVGLTLVGVGMIFCLLYRYWYTELHLLVLISGVLFNLAGVLTWSTAISYSVKFLEDQTQSATEVHACWYMSVFAGFFYHAVSLLVVFKRNHTTATVEPTQ